MTKTRLGALLLTLACVLAHAEETGIPRLIEEHTDRIPKVTVAPEYPKDARRDRIEGEVQVCYNVDDKGRPYRIAVRHSTHRVFERPSIRAVSSSSYVPLKPDEKTSGIKSCRTFRFQLEPVVEPEVDDSLAARSVLDINMIIVIGPTPPGTGVMAAATSAVSS